MANFSKFLSVISGADRTVDLSIASNILELGGGGLQMDGSTSGHVVISASATTSTYSIFWPPAQAASPGFILINDGVGNLSWGAAAATGVTSVALSLPASVFTVSGSPVTSTGTLTGSLNTQSANMVWSGPASGSAATPAFRSLVIADLSFAGVANGVATLDSGGKVPFAQLPSTLMIYLGAWNASTNTPTLADGTGINGDVYRVSVAGTQNLGSGAQTYFVGDFIIYNGTIWQRSPAADGVISVNGASGAVTVNAINQLTGDVTAGPASGSASAPSSIVATSNATLTTLSALTTATSLSSVGTIATGVWNGTAIAIANGGTGQVTKLLSFNALSPMTTLGDVIIGGSSGSGIRLGIGSTGNVLTVVAGSPAWAPISVSPASIALTQNHILVGNASNVAVDVAMTGDVAIVASGATTIQSGAVTAAKLGTVTDGITTDQNGAGSTIEVLSSPAIKEVMIAGESFAATTLFAVRFAKAADSGFVAGRAYKADNNATSADNFYVVGLVFPPGSVTASGAITATKMGVINVPSHGFTPGAPLFLGTSGAITATAPSATLTAVERVGIVRDANNIEVQIAQIGVN